MKCLVCLKETDQVIDGDELCSKECCHVYSGVTCTDGHCKVSYCPEMAKVKASGNTHDAVIDLDEDAILEF